MATTVSKPVPTLATHGWVYQIPEKCDFLLAYFFLTDGMQSYIYSDSISSIQQVIRENSNDLVNMAGKLRIRLTEYFSRYFDSAYVEVNVDESLENPNLHEIKLFLSVTQDSKTYSVGKLLRELDGKFSMVVSANNNGST